MEDDVDAVFAEYGDAVGAVLAPIYAVRCLEPLHIPNGLAHGTADTIKWLTQTANSCRVRVSVSLRADADADADAGTSAPPPPPRLLGSTRFRHAITVVLSRPGGTSYAVVEPEHLSDVKQMLRVLAAEPSLYP